MGLGCTGWEMLPGAGGDGDTAGDFRDVTMDGGTWGGCLGWGPHGLLAGACCRGGWRVIVMPLGAGGYRDAAMGVPPACVPVSRLLDSLGPAHRGSTALTSERLRRPIPALCQGSWRVPTAQPGCHDNGRQPALPFRYRDSSICSGNQDRGRGGDSLLPTPQCPIPCSK